MTKAEISPLLIVAGFLLWRLVSWVLENRKGRSK